jgi:hypothetical protein
MAHSCSFYSISEKMIPGLAEEDHLQSRAPY